MNDVPEWIGVKEASDIIGVSKDTVRTLAKQQGFPSVRIGRVFRIEKQGLYRWMEDHKGKEVVL